uniref:Claudin n=1 Tax=Serinus canaria TaxID=9135 RepID=A0A8C9NF78_SERCA
MACCVLQITGLVFGGVGMLGTLAATAMPQWRVSAYVEANMVVFESIWEGLWMDCISQLGLRLQCKLYDSVLALPPPLEALRALMCLAVLLAIVAFLVAIVGVKYSHGVAFLLTGSLVLVPVSWTGGGIVRDFYDPAVPAPLKRELGAALYVGWASSALLLAAGAMYCHVWSRPAGFGRAPPPSSQTPAAFRPPPFPGIGRAPGGAAPSCPLCRAPRPSGGQGW